MNVYVVVKKTIVEDSVVNTEVDERAFDTFECARGWAKHLAEVQCGKERLRLKGEYRLPSVVTSLAFIRSGDGEHVVLSKNLLKGGEWTYNPEEYSFEVKTLEFSRHV